MAQRKIYTFSPGPSIFPIEVLERAQKELVNYKNTGISVFEMSHRSKEFTAIMTKTEKDLRTLMKIPNNFKVLFLQGGATLQFAAIPWNLFGGAKKTANYLVTGHWSEKALEEARKYGKCNEVIPLKEVKATKFKSVAPPQKWNVNTNDGAYFYYCDNETIAGVELPYIPDAKGQTLVCDMSSNFCSKPVDWSKYGVVFACAQKNFGPAGLTLVIIREDLLNQKLPMCPTLCDFKLQVENNSLYNTGPTYSIYLAGLFFEYLLSKGDINYWNQQAITKSNLIYDTIDASKGFYKVPAAKELRSRLNIPFLIKDGNEALQKKFLTEATAQGMIQLEGHRSVGGLRASIYTGMPMAGVQKLKDFMIKFQQQNSAKL